MGQDSSRERTIQELSVFTGTWNLGNKQPPEDLTWIPRKQYDVYAIGVQECIYEARKGFMDTGADWFSSVHQWIGEDKYMAISEETLSPRTDKTYKTKSVFVAAVRAGKAKSSGIRLSVYIKKKLAKLITENSVEKLKQTCGRLDGTSGNKGGLVCSFRIGDFGICFASAHLNAHMENCDRRNQDYKRLCSQMHSNAVFDEEPEEEDAAVAKEEEELEVMNRNDIVFWFGDLNYRVELPLSIKEACYQTVVEAVKEERYCELLDHDQLKREQKAGRAFASYQEGEIKFAPTFKLSLPTAGKCIEERYNPKRVPSFCDRVLWKARPYVNVDLMGYDSDLEFANTSDHTPVWAAFKLQVPIPRTLDTAKTKDQAKIVLSDLQVSFGPDHLPPTIEDDAQIVLHARHKLAMSPAHTDPAPLEKAQWRQLTLRAEYDLSYVLTRPLLISVTCLDYADSARSKLGEAMLSLAYDADGAKFEVPLFQRGLPMGYLTGRVLDLGGRSKSVSGRYLNRKNSYTSA